MAKFVMYNKPNMSSDCAVPGLKILKQPSGQSFKVEMELDSKIEKAIKDDSVMLADMNAAADKAYDQTCDAIVSKYKAFEKLLQAAVDKGAAEADIQKQVDGLEKACDNDEKVGKVGAEHAILDVWKKYQSKKADYTKYQIKIIATITGAVAGLAVSIAMMVISPITGGASAVVAIAGLAKSVITIGKEIGSAALEIEKAHQMLAAQLAVVEKASKTLVGLKANEYTAVLVNQFLGASQPSIKTCQSQLETIQQKLTGIEVKCHDASVDLNKILNDQEKLHTDFMKDVHDQLDKSPITGASGIVSKIDSKLDGLLQTNYAAVQNAIKKVMDIHTRQKAAAETTDKLEERVAPLVGLRGLDVKIFENILYFIDMPLGALNGNVMATASNDLVQGLVPVAASMAFDKVCSIALDGTPLL